MRRVCFSLSIVVLASTAALADKAQRPSAYDEFIAAQAKKHGVPERLIHRVVKRESGYNPRLVSRACYGLMQIKHGTARSMGYRGEARGLLDPYTNMTYAIPYLANAYRVANEDEDRAVSLYASGFYYTAKRAGKLDEMHTAESAPVDSAPQAAPEPQRAPVSGLLAFLSGAASQPAPRADYPQQEAAPATAAAPAQQAPGETSAAPAAPGAAESSEAMRQAADVPLPPRRPASLARLAEKLRTSRARQDVVVASHAPAAYDDGEFDGWSAARSMRAN